MSNIQKEISQLEHWLINLPDTPSPTNPITPNEPNIDFRNLTNVINRISEQQNVQQHTLNNISDRLQILEDMREFYVNDTKQAQTNDPWIDNHCVPLQNEIIDNDDILLEPIYNINKQDISESGMSSETSLTHSPNIVPTISKDTEIVSDIKDIISQTLDSTYIEISKDQIKEPNNINPTQELKTDTEEIKIEVNEKNTEEKENTDKNNISEQTEQVIQEENIQEQEQKEELEVGKVKEVQAVQEEKAEEEVQEVQEAVQEEEAVQDEVVQQEEAVEEVEEVEEEVEEVEEEEGLELEEIVYNGIKYYKDIENFIYSIIDEQPSENPIGYWKEKTKSIAFYKTK
jgi:hypothetical protein